MSRTRSILLLGGSAQQVVAIEKARELGYRTVLCDYLPDNPGRRHADSFHLVSTTDRETVLEVARKEGVSGVVAYASDPAAPTAAYVAEKLGLPGVPFGIAEAFCEKHLFRKFLRENGFNVPRSVAVDLGALRGAENLFGLEFPIIVKPTDSSGSKGVTVVDGPDGVEGALAYASRFSRNGVVIAEEFVVRDHPHVIEAEIFVRDGVVSSWGLINSIRDDSSNPLLPAGYSYPLDLPSERDFLVRAEVSRLVRASGVRNGAFNIEMVIDAHGRLFFLDAGPRNGGNMLPDFVSMISGKDLVAATLFAAMGEEERIDVELDGKSGGFWGLGVLHASKPGLFGDVLYSSLARRSLVREELQVEFGNAVRSFEKCTDLLGLAFFKFGSAGERNEVMLHMGDSAKIEFCLPKCRAEGASFERLEGVDAVSAAWDSLEDAFSPPLKERVADYQKHLRKVALHGITLGCETQEKGLVGCVSFYANDDERKAAYISEIMVDPEAQGCGLGTAMLEAAEQWAQAFGMNKVRLEVLEGNEGARRLYERVGYVIVGYTQNGMLMEKRI